MTRNSLDVGHFRDARRHFTVNIQHNYFSRAESGRLYAPNAPLCKAYTGNRVYDRSELELGRTPTTPRSRAFALCELGNRDVRNFLER